MTTRETRRAIARTGVLLVVLGLLRWLAVEPYLLAGRSMYPTFRPRDYVLVEKLSASLFGYRRGDVVLFQEVAGGPRGLKRIVALPGDTVRIADDGVTVAPPGAAAREIRFRFPHHGGAEAPARFAYVNLGPNEVFLIGDNWDNSRDSRDFGPLPADQLRGKALLRIFPRPGLIAGAQPPTRATRRTVGPGGPHSRQRRSTGLRAGPACEAGRRMSRMNAVPFAPERGVGRAGRAPRGRPARRPVPRFAFCLESRGTVGPARRIAINAVAPASVPVRPAKQAGECPA